MLSYKRAVIATAHMMLRVIHSVLRSGTPYRDPEADHEALMVRCFAHRSIRMGQSRGHLSRAGRGRSQACPGAGVGCPSSSSRAMHSGLGVVSLWPCEGDERGVRPGARRDDDELPHRTGRGRSSGLRSFRKGVAPRQTSAPVALSNAYRNGAPAAEEHQPPLGNHRGRSCPRVPSPLRQNYAAQQRVFAHLAASPPRTAPFHAISRRVEVNRHQVGVWRLDERNRAELALRLLRGTRARRLPDT